MVDLDSLQGQAQADAASETEAIIVDPKAILAKEALRGNDVCDDDVAADQHVLRKFIVNENPEVFVVPNFLSDDEVDHLLALSVDHWAPSFISSGVYKNNNDETDLKSENSPNRTSNSCTLRSSQTPVIRSIESRLSLLAGMHIDHLEHLVVVRYEPGQFFNRHHDGRFRTKTIFLYLNDLPEGDGGETFFPDLRMKFTPRKGSAILWSNLVSEGVEDWRLVHQGLPPRTAMKYGINAFFNTKPVRQWESIDSDDEPERACKYSTVDANEYSKHDCDALAPQQLTIFRVCSDPEIHVVPGLLSLEETVGFLSFFKVLDQEIPYGAVAYEDAYKIILARLSAITRVPENHFSGLGLICLEDDMLSRPQVPKDPKRPGGTKSAFIFLNEVANRGELRFPELGLQMLPRLGCAVIWSIATPDGKPDERAAIHGRPPRTGIRYAVTCVMHESALEK